MYSPEDLKKQLEELIFYQVENDLIHYPMNKRDFAPYVVVAFSKGLTVEEIVPDVLNQLEAEIEYNKKYGSVIQVNPTIKERFMTWLKTL